MASQFISPTPIPQDPKGRAYPNAKYFFYEPSTLTAKPVYSDIALTTPLSHPVVADGSGRFPVMYLATGGYREVLKDENGVQIWDREVAGVVTPVAEAASIFGLYSTTGGGLAYTLTMTGARGAATALVDGMVCCWNPNVTNSGSGVTINPDSLGATSVTFPGGAAIPVNYLKTTKFYICQYNSSSARFELMSSYLIETDEITDLAVTTAKIDADAVTTAKIDADAVTLSKMSSGTVGRHIVFNSSGNPSESSGTAQVWQSFSSGPLTSGTVYAVTGIDDSATQIIIDIHSMRLAAGSGWLQLQVGYGSTTYLAASGDYVGDSTYINSASGANGVFDTHGDVLFLNSPSGDTAGARIVLDKVNDGTDDTWHIDINGITTSGASNFVIGGSGEVKGASLTTNLTAVKLTVPSSTFAEGWVTIKTLVNSYS